MSLLVKSRIIVPIFGAILILTGMFALMTGVAAAPPNPVLIPPASLVNVDGDIGEWDLTADFFADMHKAGNTDKEILSKLYLRYDCENSTLYAMVLVEDGNTIDDADDDNQFIKLDGSKLVDASYGNDGTPPDFNYSINSAGDKIGWEASAIVVNPGTYELNVHTQVFDDETSAVANRSIELYINCSPNEIPEFPMIAFPVAAILGIMFLLQVRNRKED